VDSDHFPVWAVYCTRLKRPRYGAEDRPRYEDPTEAQKREFNEKVRTNAGETAGSTGDLERWTEAIREAARCTLQRPTKHRAGPKMREGTRKLIREREQAIRDDRDEDVKDITKRIRREIRRDKRELMVREIDAATNGKIRWEGLRRMKKDYTPVPYTIRDKNGRHVNMRDKAAAKADYLATKQWGKQRGVETAGNQDEEEVRIRCRNKERYQRQREEMGLRFRMTNITVQEVTRVIKRLKRNKAPGPDGIPTEIMQWLDNDNIREMTRLLNGWWNGGSVDKELTRAEVVSLFKTGDTANLENYRPI
jgi:hypothetical protein